MRFRPTPGLAESGRPAGDRLGQRLLVLWAPDWPVVAHARAERLSADAPVALVDRGEVLACSRAARAEGVRRGLRQREAQSRCPGLRVLRYDSSLDARAFEPVIAGLEQLLPGVHPIRPGILAVAARGPARFYGGEKAAALALLGALHELGVADARAGVTEGLFAATLAARATRADAPVLVVPAGSAAAFLAPLPVRLLESPELGTLLPRLGVHDLGSFAALRAHDVASRFGPEGSRLHALASGSDVRAATPRTPPRDVEAVIDFEPALDRVDQVAFAVRSAADDIVTGLLEQKLVCTALRIVFEGEEGEQSDRLWLHPRWFQATEIVDRVRWQLSGALRSDERRHDPDAAGELRSAVARVRIEPETVDAAGSHERGLFGSGPEEGVHSGLSRVQGLIGHRGVLTATPSGGRGPAERQTTVPWGDRAIITRERRRPWPGRLPDPAPSTVYELPRELRVQDAAGRAVAVDERGVLSAPPAALLCTTPTTPLWPGGERLDVSSWAGPWPLDERWWDARAARRAHRFQMVDSRGGAWLLVLDERGWWAEGRYD
ncbi:DNA polymerase Y family protein [Schumannella sp. 10F1B-5-1]|uniref:DNA polymerase Y family protein n=1 Tax=Schumannella sp. 10F1B-5-1 TaxID=2590780 RepID=UPI0011317D36|nr:DNA polymerase Y family protein [Schumannella sp. 10F1B-5-1]TPW70932.1 DNA polymerase Y family protein [Schumannella sp. 10F1B-5-1]